MDNSPRPEMIEAVRIVKNCNRIYESKGLKVKAIVDADHKGLSIKTKLIEGVDLTTNTPYYFLEMPFYTLKNRDVKVNLISFKCKKELEVFQMAGLIELQKKFPELFSNFEPLSDEQLEELRRKSDEAKARKKEAMLKRKADQSDEKK